MEKRRLTFGLRAPGSAPIFVCMKRHVLVTALCACLAAPLVCAQDSPTAIAEKQEAEERYKTLSARLDSLEEAMQSHQQRMKALAEELRAMREDLSRQAQNNTLNAATQKRLENLAEKIEEVDRKRMADNEKVIATITAEIKRALSERPSGGTRGNPPPPSTTPKGGNEPGYEYTVQANDNPYVIASKLAKRDIKVTSKQIMDANPGVNWNKLKIGQKIFIPEPKK